MIKTYIKTDPGEFQMIFMKIQKTYFWKVEDFDHAILPGCILIFEEINPRTKKLTGNKVARSVGRVIKDDPGLKEGYHLLEIREPITKPLSNK